MIVPDSSVCLVRSWTSIVVMILMNVLISMRLPIHAGKRRMGSLRMEPPLFQFVIIHQASSSRTNSGELWIKRLRSLDLYFRQLYMCLSTWIWWWWKNKLSSRCSIWRNELWLFDTMDRYFDNSLRMQVWDSHIELLNFIRKKEK